MITWTIGAGGLLGNAIQRRRPRPFAGSPVPWADEVAAATVLAADLARFREEAGVEPWGIVWAAGAATVASSVEEAAAEVHTLEALLAALRAQPPSGSGAFFLTSSAGGVYAGSANPPFDADTPPVSLGAYGELKLSQEAAARAALMGVCPLVIGRFSNLYGPGQNLDKLQGLISRLAQAAATQRPLNIFVSLDTLRDYIYVDDAAVRAVIWLAKAVDEQRLEPQVRVIASGESITVGQLIRTMNQVTKRRIPTALGSHSSARNQVLDLRLIPSAADELADLPLTPLPSGAKRVYLDILRRLQAPTVTEPPSPR